jgi:hypothetical protein
VECTDDDDCDDGDPCTGNDCEDGQCQNPLIECADGETCVDGACVVVWEIQVFVSPGEAATRELTSQDAHADGSGVEIPVPDAPVIDGVTLMFVLWEGDVPTGQETADPLILIADADKTVTAVFQQLPEIPGGAACGACGAGSGVSMIMVLFGWVGLRLVGSRRVRGKTETPGR